MNKYKRTYQHVSISLSNMSLLPAFDIYGSLWFSKGLKLGRHVNRYIRIGSDKALDCFLFGWNVLGSFLTY